MTFVNICIHSSEIQNGFPKWIVMYEYTRNVSTLVRDCEVNETIIEIISKIYWLLNSDYTVKIIRYNLYVLKKHSARKKDET